jgi:hypothetical protein
MPAEFIVRMDRLSGNEVFLMKNALAIDPSHECYIVELDGIAKFEYRVFVQALSAGLQLKQEFPNCSVKLRDADDTSSVPKH